MDYPRNPKEFADQFALDYYRRPRPLRRWKWILSLAAFVVCAAAMVAAVAMPGRHGAFQAAPVSAAHASFGNDCAKCHDTPFATARRFWPGSDARSVSDAKCLACHDAGRHNPLDTRHCGANNQSARCVECHREHQGERLSRLSDSACVTCHGTVQGTHFGAPIHHFATDHPEFGAWRKVEPVVPGGPHVQDPAGAVFRFNHRAHYDLAEKLTGPDVPNKVHWDKLRQRDCAYCHQTGVDGRAMLPVGYQDHCAACHPLTVQPLPAADWPESVRAEFAIAALPHPGPGEGPAVVRAALLERLLRIADRANPPAAVGAVQPPILRTPPEMAAAAEREWLAVGRTRATEKQLFQDSARGCALCHTGIKLDGPDGLPVVPQPRQQVGRWADVVMGWPVERLRPNSSAVNPAAYADERNRWFPLATFDHRSHREMTCVACHGNVRHSADTRDVLLPARASCLECHNTAATAARSDCLACHHYHDRSQERPQPPGETRHE